MVLGGFDMAYSQMGTIPWGGGLENGARTHICLM